MCIRDRKLLEIASQPDGLVKLQQLFGGGSATDAAKVLQDFKSGGALSQQSASDIGSMVSFRGYRSGAGDFNRGRGGNFFFGQGSKGKVGSLAQVSPQVTPQTAQFKEYDLDYNEPHTIVKLGEGLYRVNSAGAIGGEPVPPGIAKTIVNKQTGQLMPMYRLQYKPGEMEIDEHLLNPLPIPYTCLLYTSPSPRDATLSRMPSSA